MAVRIMSWVLGLLFIVSGVPKIIGVAQVAAGFEQMGFSPWFRILIGLAETAGGIGLIVPATALYAAGLLIAIMVGAIWATVRVESPLPPLIVGALLAVLATLRLRRPSGG